MKYMNVIFVRKSEIFKIYFVLVFLQGRKVERWVYNGNI